MERFDLEKAKTTHNLEGRVRNIKKKKKTEKITGLPKYRVLPPVLSSCCSKSFGHKYAYGRCLSQF
jgi:hypothetical protein